MPNWAGSDRRSRLPKDWPKIRQQVFKRDGKRCTHLDEEGVRCIELATDVDHVVPGDDHSLPNLRSLCRFHHLRKSGQEGAAAVATMRRAHAKKFRRIEVHPGLIP